MSKIATYSLADSPLQLSDRLIGTEAPRPIPSATPLATKNFSLGELLQLFSSNFPAATLQAVLDAGNIATQNIDLTGRIDVTLIKPVNIEDMLGSEGTPLQILSKGVGGISWIDQPTIATPTLQQVVTQGRVYNEVGSFNQYDFEVFSGTDGIASSKTLFSRIRNIANTIVSTFSFSRSLFNVKVSNSASSYSEISLGGNGVASIISSSSNGTTLIGAIGRAAAGNVIIRPNSSLFSGTYDLGLSRIPLTGNTIADINVDYYVTTTGLPIVTDPTPPFSGNRNTYTVYCALGGAIIGGVTYGIGDLVYRTYNVSTLSWSSTNMNTSASQDLQSVTDAGNTTTNAINALSFLSNDGFGGSSSLSGSSIDIYDATGGYFTNFGLASNLYLSDATGKSFGVNANVIDLADPLGINITISSLGLVLLDNISADAWTLNYPIKPNGYVGTFAMLDDLPAAQDLQSVTGIGANTNIPITVEDTTLPLLTYSLLNKGGLYVYTSAEQSYLSHAQLSFQRGGTVINNLLIEPGGGSRNCNFYLPIKSNGDYVLATTLDIPSLTGYVPYTGATIDVNLGEFGLLTGNIEFDNTPTNIPTAAGSMYWNDSDGTTDLILKGGNVKLQVGQESVIRVVNKTATNVDLLESNYQAVRVTGAQGQRLKVDLAQATNDLLSAETIGLVTETINDNQEGFITTSGLVRNINTTGSLQGETWADGDILYLSPTTPGLATKVKPVAPDHLVILGYVVHAHITQGSIFVKVDNGYELDELHNVKITGTPANNNLLAYTSSLSIWENKTAQDAGVLTIAVPTTTGVVITFVTDRLYGSIASPETGNITADVTNAQIGVTNIIVHNSGTAPTFGAEFKKLSGSGNYVTSVVNYIYCTYINATEIIYSINQRT